MEQVIEVGSIWIDKSGENPVIVLAHNKQRQSVSFTYLLTINGKLDLTEAYSSVDLFLKTKELMVTSSSANTEYVKDKTDGYSEGYQHGFTLAKEKITELDEVGSKRIYNDGYVKGHNDGWRGAVKAYDFGNQDKEEGTKLNDDELESIIDDAFQEGYTQAYSEIHAPTTERERQLQEKAWDEGYVSAVENYLAHGGEFIGNVGCCEIGVIDATAEEEQLEKELALVKKYPHYYKDIRHLNIIDIYRFFDLFEVTDPCIQHSTKKLAVGGKRGSKDYEKDIKEAMDTLKRWEYMQEENKRGLDD